MISNHKFTAFFIFLIWGLSFARQAKSEGEVDIALNKSEVKEVRSQLGSYERGQISLDEITRGRDEAWGRKLITYYLMHTNEVTPKMLLPISRCYAGFGGYSAAAKLSQEYVNVYSNDWHGWRILGSASSMLGNFDIAVHAYTNAVRFGDEHSYAQLAYAAMKTDQDGVVSNMLSRMVALKNSNSVEHQERLQIAGMLMIYSLRTDQKDIFVTAIGGLDLKDFMAQKDLASLVNQGCRTFKGADIEKIRKELEANGGESINSTSTNAPPAAK